MYQRDYLLRMLVMPGDLIAGIPGLIKKGYPDQASGKLDRFWFNMLRQRIAD
jgi:hypothetical protein